jgi:hypothetical protein
MGVLLVTAAALAVTFGIAPPVHADPVTISAAEPSFSAEGDTITLLPRSFTFDLASTAKCEPRMVLVRC